MVRTSDAFIPELEFLDEPGMRDLVERRVRRYNQTLTSVSQCVRRELEKKGFSLPSPISPNEVESFTRSTDIRNIRGALSVRRGFEYGWLYIEKYVEQGDSSIIVEFEPRVFSYRRLRIFKRKRAEYGINLLSLCAEPEIERFAKYWKKELQAQSSLPVKVNLNYGEPID